jgi:hypothetical protein
MADPFESAWLKWAQGVGNGEVLLDNILTLAEQPNLKMETWFGQQYDAQRHCIRLIARVTNPFPAHWGPMLGDVIHNYRSCLDHLAWALHKRGRTPNLTEKQERAVYFPITSKREIFNACLKGDRAKLPGVRRADVAKVRLFQPYKAGQSRVHRHVFTVLDELANADKHRTIQPVIAVPNQIAFPQLAFFDCIRRKFVSTPNWSGASDPRAEFGRFYVKKDGSEPRVDMQPHFSLVPAVNELLTVGDFLNKTMALTSIVLREFAEPPESALRMLAGHAEALALLEQRDKALKAAESG